MCGLGRISFLDKNRAIRLNYQIVGNLYASRERFECLRVIRALNSVVNPVSQGVNRVSRADTRERRASDLLRAVKVANETFPLSNVSLIRFRSKQVAVEPIIKERLAETKRNAIYKSGRTLLK